MRTVTPLSNSPLRVCVLLVALAASACGREITVPAPEGPVDPGFFGTWTGTFQGSDMTLSIREFNNGVAPGDVLWREVTWGLECTAVVTPERTDLSCDVIPSAEVPACGDPAPFIDIEQSIPRDRIVAAVGGVLREGAGNPCDGEVIVSWEPGESVTFVFS